MDTYFNYTLQEWLDRLPKRDYERLCDVLPAELKVHENTFRNYRNKNVLDLGRDNLLVLYRLTSIPVLPSLREIDFSNPVAQFVPVKAKVKS
jgi:hypothetical protein